MTTNQRLFETGVCPPVTTHRDKVQKHPVLKQLKRKVEKKSNSLTAVSP